MTKSSDAGDQPQVRPVGHPAMFEEEVLLADCEMRRQRRSGPGGQHRNKVETAVRITHTPTGVRGEASERRSQVENRSQAIFRLRVNLALQVRTVIDLGQFATSPLWQSRCRAGKLTVNSEHGDFPALLAEALDLLAAVDYDVKSAAKKLGCSTSQLVRFCQQEPRAVERLNDRRRSQRLPPYR